MAKDLVGMSLLYDLYSGMLTEKQRFFFELYYNDDLSLAEIAENEGISRQGARDNIVRAEETLKDCEERLHLIEKMNAIRRAAVEMSAAAQAVAEINRYSYFDTRIKDNCEKIIKIARALE